MIVTNAAELRRALVGSLQGMPALLTLLRNNPDNVVEYVEALRGDLSAAIRELKPPKLLVYIEGVAATPFPARFTVSIGIAMRTEQEPMEIFATMLSSISETSGGDGQPLLTSVIHPGFDPTLLPSLERRFIPLDATSVFDYWEMRLQFKDRP